MMCSGVSFRCTLSVVSQTMKMSKVVLFTHTHTHTYTHICIHQTDAGDAGDTRDAEDATDARDAGDATPDEVCVLG